MANCKRQQANGQAAAPEGQLEQGALPALRPSTLQSSGRQGAEKPSMGHSASSGHQWPEVRPAWLDLPPKQTYKPTNRCHFKYAVADDNQSKG